MPEGTIGFNPLRGFLEAAGDDRQRTHQQNLQRDQRELSILESLAKSPDTDISSAAIAGLLNFSDPRKKRKGIAGFIGETEGHPALGLIRNLLQTPVIETDSNKVERGLPGFAPGQLSTAPPAMGAAAQAGTSPVTGGPMASPAPVASRNPAVPPPAQTGLPTPPPDYKPKGSPTTVRMRQAFLPPEEQQLRTARAKAQGDVEGEVAGLVASGMSEQEARDLVKQSYAKRVGSAGMAGQTYAEGEITPDPDSPTGFSQILYLRSDPTKQQKIPASPKTATSSRAVNDEESIAAELFGDKYPGVDPRTLMTQLTTPERAQVSQTKIRRAGEQRYATATASGQAGAEKPLNRQQIFQATTDLQAQWTKSGGQAKELAKQLYMMQAGLRAAERGDQAAGSQAVLVTFQKILDPESVVREAEYFRSASGLSLLQRAQGAFERMKEGGAGVPLAELKSFARLAEEITQVVQADAVTHRDRIAATASTFGLDPKLVLGADAPSAGVGPPPAAPGAQQAAPAPGAAPVSAPPPPPSGPLKVGDAIINPATGETGKVLAVRPDGTFWPSWRGPVPKGGQ